MNLADYPSGFVTIVFTDIVASTKITSKLNATERSLYETQLRNPHRDRLFALLKEHSGHEIQRAGDGHMVVFASPQKAIACLTKFQNQLREDPIRIEIGDEEFVVQVRAGIHTSERTLEPESKEENGKPWVEYSGGDINLAARVSALGDGGQILLSQSAYDRAKPEVLNLNTHAWPDRYLKSFEHAPQTVHEILYQEGQQPRELGLRLFSEWYQDERNRYITRETEEEAVITCFSQGVRGNRPRFVTIHAEGGMGKTRLSVACALKMADIFEHNIHFVKLADTPANPYAVAEAIGAVLGKSGPQAQPDALCAALRHKNILLLLDNYESCAHDEVARFVTRLVTQTTGVHLLVTGRQPVGVRNIEQIVPLGGGLTYPQAQELFLERAALDGRHNHPLTVQEHEQLNRILRLVSVSPDNAESGPIPLAVELAAAWWSEKKLKEIADGLEATPLKKYMEPVPGTVPEVERHESLYRSLQWSYDLLGKIPEIGPRLQTMFALCGLFPETFDSKIVQEIGGAPDTDELLIRLHRVSMLQERGTPECTFYRLHHFAREYARQKLLKISNGSDLKSKFVAYYADLIEKHKNINDLKNHPVLDESWRNALAATQWAIKAWEAESVEKLVDSLMPFLELRGLWSEWESLYLQILEVMHNLENRRGEGVTLNNLGNAYKAQNRWREAERAYQDSLAICREFGDRVGEGTPLNNLGLVYQSQNRWQEAEKAYQGCLAICGEFGNRMGQGLTLNNLGNVYQSQNRWREAERAYQDSLAISREFGDRVKVGGTLNNLGNVYRTQNRWREAEQAFQDSLAIRREFGDRVGEGTTLNNLGLIYESQNRWQEAEKVCQDSLAIRREFGDRVGEGTTLNNLGLIYQSQNRWQEAEQAFQDSLAISREFEIKDRVAEGRNLNGLGNLYQSQNRWREAEQAFQDSIAIWREFGERVAEGLALNNLGLVYQSQIRLQEAEQAFQDSLAIKREFGDRVGEGRTLENIAALRFAQNDLVGAVNLARQAVQALSGTQAVTALEKARMTLAHLEGKMDGNEAS